MVRAGAAKVTEGASAGPASASGPLADALAFHAEHPPIDLHADTLMWARWVGYDIHARNVPPLPWAALGGHVDEPRLREGGLGGQFFGLVSLPVARRGVGRAVDEQIDLLDAAIAMNPGKLQKARTAADVEAARAAGTIAALLGIEGAHALEGDLDRVAHFARRGVRYLGLLHFSANEAGFPAYGSGRRDTDGLTRWGKELVLRCGEAGMLVDLAHINRRGFFEACALTQGPPLVSHTGLDGAHPHWRNIDDEQLRLVADRGGVVGVIFVPQYLGGSGIDAVVRHIRHVIDVAGEDTPALGSDWDGAVVPTTGLAEASQLPRLTAALLAAGLSERTVAKVLRDNVMRVLALTLTLVGLAIGAVACTANGPYPAAVIAARVEAGAGSDGDLGAEAGPRADSAAITDSAANGDADASPAEPARFCDLPGSVRFTSRGVVKVPPNAGTPGASGSDIGIGDASTPETNPVDLAFLQLPPGFCAHAFGKVHNARQIRFAPGGELFVASPTTYTIGGDNTPDPSATGKIVVLPDDDHDGVADASLTFLTLGWPGSKTGSTQGLLFTSGLFYYQQDSEDGSRRGTRIMSMPYAPGDRSPRGAAEEVADIAVYYSETHWPKPLDQADDGTIYVGNGGDQDEICDLSHPFHGGILQLGDRPGGTPIARGFRNPIALRCQRGKNRCFAIELGLDNSYLVGGREKLVLIRPGDDWGFPCCLAKDVPSLDSPRADCSMVAPDDISFYIGSTPFGLDFEPGAWPAPYSGSVFVVLHGAVGNYAGARVVAIAVDPGTGMPLAGDDLSNMMSAGAMTDFATGWDDTTQSHGRPAAIAFAQDGRMFLANDNNGDIFWIAPFDLLR